MLKQVDELLVEVESDKSHNLSANIWLSNMEDFEGANGVWDACGKSKLTTNDLLVEVIIVAAKRS